MSDSNRSKSRSKARPRKPPKDFPLRIHRGTGYWCKKVKGKVHYFGRVADDPEGQAALEEWLRVKDDLYAGRVPRVKADTLAVGDLCNAFLEHKERLRDSGELNPRTFRDYYDTCKNLVLTFGRNRAVTDLTPGDFGELRARLAKTMAAVTLRNEMQRARSVFKFGFDEGLLSTPVRFGQSFGRPRLDVVRKAREAHRAEHGDRMFEAHEIRAILAEAEQPLRTIVLLGANGAFGQSDLSALPVRAVDLKAGWVDFARVKTAVPRRVPLWLETVQSIREWLPQRPKALHPADAGLLFLTVPRGARFVTVSKNGSPRDAIGQQFDKALRKLGLKRPRLGFYGLRHGFETIAGETTDQVAVDAIMGHTPQGMGAHYRERIGEDRLRAVTEYVRTWLFAEPDGCEGQAPAATDAPDRGPREADGDDGPVTLRLFAG